MKENLLVLEGQISSASGELQKLKAEQDELTPLAAIRGRICNRCHQSGHTKTTCKSKPCESSNNCKIREKHPEMKAQNLISSLQSELKEVQKQHEKQRSESERFVAAREKSKSIFFSVMRNILRLQNLPKYSDRLKLDKDLLVLQRASWNEVPKWDPREEGDWQLPIIIEQFPFSSRLSCPLFGGEKIRWRPFCPVSGWFESEWSFVFPIIRDPLATFC